MGGFGLDDLRASSASCGSVAPTSRSTDCPSALGSVVVYWLGQKKVTEKPMTPRQRGFTSLHHLCIFWGFLIITIGTDRALGQRARPACDFSLLCRRRSTSRSSG